MARAEAARAKPSAAREPAGSGQLGAEVGDHLLLVDDDLHQLVRCVRRQPAAGGELEVGDELVGLEPEALRQLRHRGPALAGQPGEHGQQSEQPEPASARRGISRPRPPPRRRRRLEPRHHARRGPRRDRGPRRGRRARRARTAARRCWSPRGAAPPSRRRVRSCHGGLPHLVSTRAARRGVDEDVDGDERTLADPPRDVGERGVGVEAVGQDRRARRRPRWRRRPCGRPGTSAARPGRDRGPPGTTSPPWKRSSAGSTRRRSPR